MFVDLVGWNPIPAVNVHSRVARNFPREWSSHYTLDYREETPEVALSEGLKSVPLVGLEPIGESAEETAEKRELTPQGGAHSGAFSDCSSPTLAVLLKLAARLTAEDRGALARALQPPAG